MPNPLRMNVVGAGTTARVLARLWRSAGTFEVAGICNRSRASAEQAAAFIGGGSPARDIQELVPAPVWMLGCPDDALERVARQLEVAGAVDPSAVVFHLSGAREARLLDVIGAKAGGFHPVLSFADPELALRVFSGSLVAVEGTDEVVAALSDWARAIGGRPFRLTGRQKIRYHVASVTAANHMVAVLDMAIGWYRDAGLDEAIARELSGSLAAGVLENVAALGCELALTGPIVRGDLETVAAHLDDLESSERDAYIGLARATLALACRSGRLDPKTAAQIEMLLSGRE